MKLLLKGGDINTKNWNNWSILTMIIPIYSKERRFTAICEGINSKTSIICKKAAKWVQYERSTVKDTKAS